MKKCKMIFRNLTGFAAVLAVIQHLYLPLCAAKGTKLHRIRSGLHSGFTRLVFDAEGDHPTRIGPHRKDGTTVAFSMLEADMKPDEPTLGASSAVSAVSIRKAGSLFEVDLAFRYQESKVNHIILEGHPPQPGHYRLVMDIIPPPARESSAVQEAPGQEPRESSPGGMEDGKPRSRSKPAAVDPSSNSGNAGPDTSPSSCLIDQAAELTSQGDHAQAYQLYEKALEQAVSDSGRATALYGLAEAYFLMHQHHLDQHGPRAIEFFLDALKADAGSPRAPWALYRTGLCYEAAGGYDKAEQFFEKLISSYPEHPLVGLSWLALGEIRLKTKSPVESVLAYRSALRIPLERPQKLEALYGLGKNLALINEHEEAVKALKNCLEEDPLFYLKKPDTLKLLGESLFGIKKYSESQDYLLWYLNIQPDAPDRDLTIARIAETLAHQHEDGLVDRLHSHLQTRYPDSEGTVISSIRRAEILEKTGPNGRKEARTIYQGLSQQNLSETLSRLILFKLAAIEWQDGAFRKSLEILDGLLSGSKGSASHTEALALREKVIVDWTRKAFTDKDYFQVMQLYVNNQAVFLAQSSPELDAMVAESFGELKLYLNALAIFQRILSEEGGRNEEWMLKAAQYAFHMNDTARALQWCTQIQSPDLELPRAELLARIYRSRKEHSEVVQSVERVLKKGNISEVAAKRLLPLYGESLMHMGKFDEALSSLQKAAGAMGTETSSEERVQLQMLQKDCYLQLKQPQKAVEVLEGLVSRTESAELKDSLSYELAGLYLDTGQTEKAVEVLRQLLESPQSLWKVAAEQQLDYIRMQGPRPGSS